MNCCPRNFLTLCYEIGNKISLNGNPPSKMFWHPTLLSNPENLLWKMVIYNINMSKLCFKDSFRHLEQPYAKLSTSNLTPLYPETRVKLRDRQPKAEKLLGDIYNSKIQPKLFPLKINTWKQILKPKFRPCLQFLICPGAICLK